jgi:hypothetical protein
MRSLYLLTTIIFFANSALGMERIKDVENPENIEVLRDAHGPIYSVEFKKTLNMQALLGILTTARLQEDGSFIKQTIPSDPQNKPLNSTYSLPVANGITNHSPEKRTVPSKILAKKTIIKQTHRKKYYCNSPGCKIYSLWQAGITTHRLSHVEERNFLCPIKHCHGALLNLSRLGLHLKSIHYWKQSDVDAFAKENYL